MILEINANRLLIVVFASVMMSSTVSFFVHNFSSPTRITPSPDDASKSTVNSVIEFGSRKLLMLSGENRILLTGATQDGKEIFCSEPHTDIALNRTDNSTDERASAIKTLLDGLSAKGEISADVKNKISVASSDNVNNLIERSQGLQIMRDMLYRLCEADLNESLDQSAHAQIWQEMLNTLSFSLAVESCTNIGGENLVPDNGVIQSCLASSLDFINQKLEREGNRNIIPFQ